VNGALPDPDAAVGMAECIEAFARWVGGTAQKRHDARPALEPGAPERLTPARTASRSGR
jgi:hypothetical protein